MDFKAFILCFAFFVVTASGSPLCKCAQTKDTVSKYNLKVKEGNKEVDETVEIDTEKETESINIPSNGDNSTSAPGEVDVVFDFKLNMAMHRLSNQKACFLTNSTDNLPKPADLNKLLELESSQKDVQLQTPKMEYEYVVDGTLDDRSILSDEMAHLCAKLPIYRVKAIRSVVEKEKILKRRKRQYYYNYCRQRQVRCCYYYCYAPGCCGQRCFWHDVWVCN